MKLWLDDIREAPFGWTWAKTYAEAVAHMETGTVTEASLDHDLGEDDHRLTGYLLVNWMEAHGVFPNRVAIHSANSVGRDNIIRALKHNGFRQAYGEAGSCFLKPTFDRA